MITLEVADLVVIASRTLGLDTGQVLDVLDATAAEFALAQARQGGDPGDLVGQAAVLLDALVRGQPLRRGNQQVALAAVLQFLALNGQEMDPDPPGPVAALVAGLAAGTLDTKTVAERLAPRLWPGRSARGSREGGTDAGTSSAACHENKGSEDAEAAPGHVRAVHRPGQTGRLPGAGGSQAAGPRLCGH
jgi:prophage maintenance system killer protein